MKKLTLFVIFLVFSSMLFAQIGEITPNAKRFETTIALKNVYVVHDNEDDSYDLCIGSDNQFEEKNAYLKLGHGAQEALTSLSNLYKAIQTPEITFEVGEYTISTFVAGTKHYGMVHTIGALEFAAGSYAFEEEALGNAMIIIIDKIPDFDYPSIIVKTKRIYGDANSSIGITGVLCDFYHPQLNVHFVGGVDKVNIRSDKNATKLMALLPPAGDEWKQNDFKVVVMGIDNNVLKILKPFFEKVFRAKAQ